MRDIILLNNVKYKNIKNMPLFEIEYLSSSADLSKYDALIFTSKNAILSLDSFNKKWREIPSYCIAKKTSEVLKKFDANLVFTGEKSHGDEFAKELIPLLKNKKTLYVKAEKTVSSLVDILKDANIDIDKLVTYKTVCTKKSFDKPSDGSIIIFTSPSSIECFFKIFQWSSSYEAIVIGNTTAKYMPKNIEYKISKSQTIDSCVKLALSL